MPYEKIWNVQPLESPLTIEPDLEIFANCLYTEILILNSPELKHTGPVDKLRLQCLVNGNIADMEVRFFYQGEFYSEQLNEVMRVYQAKVSFDEGGKFKRIKVSKIIIQLPKNYIKNLKRIRIHSWIK